MKKIYTLIFTALFAVNASAQFFTYTEYRGAFGVASSTNWTQGWANWDPENIVYPVTTMTVQSDITSNTTWSTGSVVLLKNKVYVTGGATLTIQPGVIIRGDKATEGTLIISKGSKIMAQGSAANPIVFTSNFSVDDGRSPGDWGGVIILGNAVNNQGAAVVEGGLDANKAAYGGYDNNDNSGVFQFVRIEFAGFPFQPDKEINGLTLGSVGSGTTIDHVQVSFCNDDAFEWFGGTVNAKYLISYRCVDDDFDTDFGYSGKVQFGLILRDPDLADQCSCSTSEGFESDNDGSGTAATPQTSAVFSNITVVGPYRGSTSNAIDSKFKRALRIRRNSSISIFNSVFSDWGTGLHIDGTAAETNATNGGLVFKSNVLSGMGTNLSVNSGSTFDINTFFTSNNNTTSTAASAVMFVNPYPADFNNPDYRLQAGSPLLTGSDFTHAKVESLSIGMNETVNEIGAINLSPNPATQNPVLNFALSKNNSLTVNVLDITGKLVSKVIDSSIVAEGTHSLVINVENLNAGIYIVSVKAGEMSKNIRMVVSK